MIDWNFPECRAMMLDAFEQRTITRSNLNILRRKLQMFDQSLKERFVRFVNAIGRGYVSVIEDGAQIDNRAYYLSADGEVKAYTKDIFQWGVK